MTDYICKKVSKTVSFIIVIALLAALATPAGISAKTKNKSENEFRGVWIAYYDFDKSKGYGKSAFTEYVRNMFDNVKDMGMNAVMVHVRPFSDAMYRSAYYPWSYYASGTQGKDPGYDPLEIMVSEAHARDLEIHAWINPYRVSTTWNYGTDTDKLSKKNPARKWLTNSKTADDRNVLAFGGAMYYNPAVPAVRKLIVNGVKEIVTGYDVDGIHLDDYFYPALGDNYETAFDAPEYEEYAAGRRTKGKKPLSIADWRRKNVNTLVSALYAAVKEIRPGAAFGISPGGYIDYLKDDNRWYVDYETWMGNEGYIDYICPQLYWSFNTKNIYPYYETMQKWLAARTCDTVKVYAGLPAYKLNEDVRISSINSNIDSEFYNQFLLADYVTYGRRCGGVAGYIFFDYEDMTEEKNRKAVENLKEIW
ncbi:MAG: family 10 glycosylhydrolase [Lachnospiraceae bacterium]|nr:family 10 glycosylhydrolase [Lachnospiraceae bacterium]